MIEGVSFFDSLSSWQHTATISGGHRPESSAP